MIREVFGTNFLSFEKLHVQLPASGLVHIFGRVDGSDVTDSNGAGKTAILSLIRWVLFGENDRGNADDVIRKGSKGGISSYINLIDRHGRTLCVSRYRKHKEHKNELHVLDMEDGSDLTGTDNKDTQLILNERMGIDYNMFQRGFVFDGSLSIARMKDTEAKDLFERLIGTDFESQHMKAKAALSATHQELNTVQNQVANVEGQMQQVEALRASLVEQESQWKAVADGDIFEAEGQYDLLDEEVAELDQRPTANVEQAANNVAYLEGEFKTAQKHATARTTLEVKAASHLGQIQAAKNVSSTCPTCGHAFSTQQQAEYKVMLDGLVVHHGTMLANLDLLPTAEEIAAAQTTYTNATAAWNLAQQELQKWDNEYANVRHQQDALKQKIEGLKVNLYTNQIADAEKVKNDCVSALNASHATVTAINQRIANWNTIVEMFGGKGLRSFILDGIIPHLNARLAYYLGIVTGGEIAASFNTTTKTGKERFHITVERKNGGSTYESLSQGEKSRLDLCLILALHEYLRSMVGAPLLFFDELMDGLDATGTERVLGILKAIAQDTQIIVISHNPHVAQYTDYVLTVVKENGISRIEQV